MELGWRLRLKLCFYEFSLIVILGIFLLVKFYAYWYKIDIMPKHDNLWLTTKWCDLEEREVSRRRRRRKKLSNKNYGKQKNRWQISVIVKIIAQFYVVSTM